MKLVLAIGAAVLALMILIPFAMWLLGAMIGLIKFVILAAVLIFIVGLVIRMLKLVAR